MPDATRVSFGPYQLDLGNELLTHHRRQVRLRPKTMRVLTLLVRHAGRVVSRSEIIDSVWSDVAVQDDILTTSISELRQALQDSALRPRYIETVHKKGFRFIAAVQASASLARRTDVATNTSPADLFVGRGDALAILSQKLADAVAGGTHVVMVSGPAGIGKTHLLRRFVATYTAQDLEILEARAHDASQDSALRMWAQILDQFAHGKPRKAVRAALGAAAPDLAALMPSLADHLGTMPGGIISEPEFVRSRLLEGIIGFVKKVAAERPLVFVIDEIHKASSTSLAILQAVLGAGIERLLIVTAHREGEEPSTQAFAELIETAHRTGNCTLSPLHGLSDDDARWLVGELSTVAIAAPLADKIVHDTKGNPLFIREIVRSVGERPAANGRLQQGYEISAGIRSVIELRMRRLSDTTRSLLQVGAVFGSSFDARIAASVAGIDQQTLWSSISEGTRSGLVEESADHLAQLDFSHDLLRTTLIQGMTQLQRTELHARIADALEQRGGSSDTDVARLAFHFAEGAEAGRVNQAIEHCLRAGQRALDRCSDAEAKQLLLRALALCEETAEPPGERLFRVLYGLSEAYGKLEDFAEQEAYAERLHAMAHALHAPEWLAKSAIALLTKGYLPYRPPTAKAIVALRTALNALDPQPTELRGRALARLAAALLGTGEDDERIRLGREAVAIARRLPDGYQRAHLLYETIVAFWDADRIDERLVLADELRDTAAAAGSRYLECAALSWKAMTLLGLGRFNDLEAVRSAVLHANTGFDYQIVERSMCRFDISLALQRGRLDVARQLMATHARFGSLPGSTMPQFELFFAEVALKRELGSLGELVPGVRFLAQQYPSLPLRPVLAFLLAESGDTAAAGEELDAMLGKGLRELPPRNEAWCWLEVVAALGETCAAVGARPYAGDLYALLAPYRQQWMVVHETATVIGSVERILGQLAALDGSLERAEQHFEAIAAVCNEERIVTELARTKLAHATMLELARRSPHKASTLRQQSLDLARAHGLEAQQQQNAG